MLRPVDTDLLQGALRGLLSALVVELIVSYPNYWAWKRRDKGTQALLPWWLIVGLISNWALFVVPYVAVEAGLPRYVCIVIGSQASFRVLEIILQTAPPDSLSTYTSTLMFILSAVEPRDPKSSRIELSTVIHHFLTALFCALMFMVLFGIASSFEAERVPSILSCTAFLQLVVWAVKAGAFLFFLSSCFEMESVIISLLGKKPMPFCNNLRNSQTLLQFWSRWNMPVHIGYRRVILLPLKRARVPLPLCYVLVFLVSGLCHSIVLFVGYNIWSWTTIAFFVLQFMAAQLQMSVVALQNRVFTVFILALLSGLFIHPLHGTLDDISRMLPSVVF
ncbi:hypothetical protein Pelo_12461 [Pelomyxa schiedti]|nr:hypothetical protein Pelo_12461 [Pelomyxa schiedti]